MPTTKMSWNELAKNMKVVKTVQWAGDTVTALSIGLTPGGMRSYWVKYELINKESRECQLLESELDEKIFDVTL